jgi:acyl-CoA hydrolase
MPLYQSKIQRGDCFSIFVRLIIQPDFFPENMKNIKFITAKDAVKVVKSNDRVHLHGVAVTPLPLIHALCERGRNKEFRNVRIQHIHTEGPAPYADQEFEGIFQLESFFVGHNVRKQTQSGYADYIPVFLHETQRLIREGYLKVNVAMIQVSVPDKFGFVSLGTSVEATLAAVEKADTVIAIVNPNVPRAFGDAMFHIEEIDLFVEDDSPLITAAPGPISDNDRKIGHFVAELVEDGATLQMGIGAIPNAVLTMLGNHKDLGVHSEMFADGILPLVYKGVVNGKNKNVDKGRMVATFLMGSKNLYDFVNDNPGVAMLDVAYTNRVNNIAQNPKVTAINSALQIDITGQVCADSIGTVHYSGVGGQIDFLRGASLSQGGKPIIAIPSVTNKGISKIAPVLTPGAGVVSTRANIHWLVTEYGAVNLYGRSLQDRAKLIISIAHPDHQETLDKAAFERFGPHFHFVWDAE